MTIVQLRVLAKEKGVHSPTTLNKAQLIQKLSEKLNSETPAVTQHEYPADSFKPVSYTHLDVYKRQTYYVRSARLVLTCPKILQNNSRKRFPPYSKALSL